MTDLAEALIASWIRWEAVPRSHQAAGAKFDAIRALGLCPICTAETIARHRRAGMSIPDAVQTVINDQGAV